MDTKSRIGLFAGGLVLVGMVAYVMMPRAPQTDGVTVSTDSSSATGDLAAAAPTTRPATTQPVAIADPFATPEATSASPGAAPAPKFQVAAVDANDAWARALDTGSTQSHSGNLSKISSLTPETSTLTTPVVGHKSLSATPSQKTYKVESGDSPVSISTKVYGNGKYASKILDANPGINPKHLKIGQELKLPDVAAETPTFSSSSASLDHTDPLPTAAATANQKTYKVQSGDTLTKIATRLYGKGDMWKKLYAANKGKIGSDPTHLRAGIVLQIPDNIQ
jgi:nucleoid-associated protein YgaU